MRKTKIIATLGPASSAPSMLTKLIDEGVNCFRINASHASHGDIANLTEQVHRLGRLMRKPVAVLLDLCGPKVRLGKIEVQDIEADQEIGLTGNLELVDQAAGVLPCNYRSVAGDVQPGQRLLIDDGLLEFEVLGVDGDVVRLRALRAGRLKPRKGINLPDSTVGLPALTDKDKADLAVGVDAGVDYVALSFVQRAQDVIDLKEELQRLHSPDTPIIAKIEKPQAVDRLDEILAENCGVMVARGDLGVETGAHRVAVLQKMILSRCHKVGAIDIVATQMLDSMERNPTPTRAEANDVGNSILDGVDAVMLSGETAAGKYPLEAVRVMGRIAEEIEAAGFSMRGHFAEPNATRFHEITQEIARAACYVARHERYKGIIALTASSKTARVVSSYYPGPPIFGITPSLSAYRRMALLRGVTPVHMKFSGTSHDILRDGERLLLKEGLLKEGDYVVVVAGTVENPGAAHMVKILRMGQLERMSDDSLQATREPTLP